MTFYKNLHRVEAVKLNFKTHMNIAAFYKSLIN